MLARLRPLYNKIVLPIGQFSYKLGFSANFWTLFSLLLAIIGAYAIVKGQFWWGLALVILMFLADMLDGATARASGTTSRFGTVFDHVVDRYAEYIILSALLLGGWISPAAAMISSSGVIMASYVRAKAESAGGLKECLVGIAGRAEKLFLMYGAIILLGFGYNQIAEYMIWIIGIISHITAIQRLIYTRLTLAKLTNMNQPQNS